VGRGTFGAEIKTLPESLDLDLDLDMDLDLDCEEELERDPDRDLDLERGILRFNKQNLFPRSSIIFIFLLMVWLFGLVWL